MASAKESEIPKQDTLSVEIPESPTRKTPSPTSSSSWKSAEGDPESEEPETPFDTAEEGKDISETKGREEGVESKLGETKDLEMDPESGEHMDPESGEHRDPESGEHRDPESGEHRDPQSGEHRDPQSGEHRDPESGEQKGAESGEQKGAESGEQKGAESGEQKGAESGEQKGAESGEQKGAESGEQKGAEKSAAEHKDEKKGTDEPKDEEQDAALGTEQTEEGEQEKELRPEYIFKVLIVGEAGTGKTALVYRYRNRIFQDFLPTRGFHLLSMDIQRLDCEIALNMIDVSGSEGPSIIRGTYYKGCTGVILVYDTTKETSFGKTVEWAAKIRECIKLPGGRPVPCILMLTKCDEGKISPSAEHHIRTSFCKNYDILEVFRTSAEADLHIDMGFYFLIDEMIQRNENARDARDDPLVLQDPEVRRTEVRRKRWWR